MISEQDRARTRRMSWFIAIVFTPLYFGLIQSMVAGTSAREQQPDHGFYLPSEWMNADWATWWPLDLVAIFLGLFLFCRFLVPALGTSWWEGLKWHQFIFRYLRGCAAGGIVLSLLIGTMMGGWLAAVDFILPCVFFLTLLVTGVGLLGFSVIVAIEALSYAWKYFADAGSIQRMKQFGNWLDAKEFEEPSGREDSE